MPDVYVGLGSNHEPGENLRRAVARLAERFGAVTCSAVYRAAAVGEPAPDYYNLVAHLATSLEAAALGNDLKQIEAAAGRDRSAPTVVGLDLDLLLYGARVDPKLRVPRTDVLRHAFVLVPLAEIAPQLTHPVTGQSMRAARGGLTATGLVRVGTIDAPHWD